MLKRMLSSVYQCIVGEPYGFGGEGNSQWYFFLSLVIINQLTWTFKPELAVVFTVLSVLCFAVVCVYSSEMLGDELCYKNARRWVFAYLAFHFVIAVVCLILNWWWTLLMALIVIAAILLAPDDGGCNFFIDELDVPHTLSAMLCHTVLFAIFVTTTCLLPVATWVKLVIIAICMILHPIIDIWEGDCMSIEDAMQDTMRTLDKMSEKRKRRKAGGST